MKVHVLLADKGTNNPQAGTLNLLNAGWGVTQVAAVGFGGDVGCAAVVGAAAGVDVLHASSRLADDNAPTR